MNCDVVWSAVEEPAVEHLHGDDRFGYANGHEFSSVIAGMQTGQPTTLRYTLQCDADWRTLRVTVTSFNVLKRIWLHSDGAGNWTAQDGEPLEHLAGCIDVDISATPFTNTLPVNRLRRAPNKFREIDVVYIGIPAFIVSRRQQRYTRLGTGSHYRFESLESGKVKFSADIEVDSYGLVLDYPGLFTRVFMAPGEPR